MYIYISYTEYFRRYKKKSCLKLSLNPNVNFATKLNSMTVKFKYIK